LAEQTPEQLRQINDLLQAQRDELEAINNLSESQRSRLDAIAKLQKQVKDAQAEERTLRQESLDAMRDAAIEAEARKDALEDEIRLIRDRTKLGEKISDEDQKQVDALNAKIVSEEAIIAQIEVENELRRDSTQVAEDLLETTLGISKQQQGVVGLLQKSVNSGKSFGESLADVGSDLFEGMNNVLTPTNMLASVASKVAESTVKMVFDTDNALANFNQMTTAGGELNDVIFQASLDTKEFGVGMADTVAAAGELYTSMSGFTELSAQAQGEVLTLAAGMEKAGVSAADTGKIFDTAMKGFGMSAGEAQDLSKELLATSQALNVPAGQLAQNFNSAMGELAKYGPKGIDVFKGLSAQAKAAGVEMNTLLGVAGNFDTIEGAANATSRLNAVLGTQLNSMEMLALKDHERIALLQESVNASGKSFDEMDRFEKQAIASAAGISDMNEAAKLFNAETSAFAEATDSMDDITGAQADMQAATQASTSAQEKMALIMEQMAIAVMPLISLMHELINVVMGVVGPVFKVANAIIDFLAPALEFIAKGIAGLAMVVGVFMIPALVKMAIGFVSATIAALPIIALFVAIAAVGYVLYEVIGWLVGRFMDLGSAIMDAFSGNFDGLHDIFVQPFIDAWNAITDFFGFASPAKVAGDLGQGILDGLSSGMSTLYDVFVQPFVDAFDFVSGFASTMFDGISNFISNIGDFVVELGSTIASFFGGLFAPILDFLAPIIDILRPFFNFFIEGMNFILTGLNSLSFTVPDWVPGIGGEEFGFNLPLIPMLQEGGVIDDDGVAYLHQGEKVLPTADVSALDEATSAAMDVMASPLELVGGLVGGAADAIFGTDEQLIAAIKENTAAIAALAGAGGGNEGGKTIVLQMNERELGRAVTKTLNDRNNLTLG
jgi:hypothetical protein